MRQHKGGLVARAVLLAPLLVAGCMGEAGEPLAPAEASPSDEPGEAADRGEGPRAGPVRSPGGGGIRPGQVCSAPGVLLDDAPSLTTGGGGGSVFEVGTDCVVSLEFDVERQLGGLRVHIASPEHELLYRETGGVAEGEVAISAGTAERRAGEGTTPPGTYTYEYEAELVAEFRVRVVAT